VSPGG
jgi:Na+-transporting methylmalonyl-CoA/oxaloacetate decarboxylase gamma subunit